VNGTERSIEARQETGAVRLETGAIELLSGCPLPEPTTLRRPIFYMPRRLYVGVTILFAAIGYALNAMPQLIAPLIVIGLAVWLIGTGVEGKGAPLGSRLRSLVTLFGGAWTDWRTHVSKLPVNSNRPASQRRDQAFLSKQNA
jgi:hypothetical protein